MHRVIVDDRDVTRELETLQFSNSDPGGFEALQCEQLGALDVRAGAPVVVIFGGECAWHGRLNEKGENDSNARLANAAAIGYGSKLKDDPFSMVYVDRDLSQWRDASAGRRLAISSASADQDPGGVAIDTSDGLPSLRLGMTGSWPRQRYSEMWYDAGLGNVIGGFFYSARQNSSINLSDNLWTVLCYSALLDGETGNGFELQVADMITGTGSLTSNNAYRALSSYGHRYLLWQLTYGAAAGGNQNYDFYLRNLAIFGDHRLPVRDQSTDATYVNPGGLHAADIALHAARSSGARFAPVVADTVPFVVAHAVYKTPVFADQVIGEMATLQGYHWGVWEPGLLDTMPRLFYAAPPADATVVIDRRECTSFQSPSIQYDRIYDTVVINYTDPAGTAGSMTVTMPHPLLLDRRVLSLDMGVGSSAAATAFGNFALRLSQQSARGGGSAVLPSHVKLPGGGFRPSSLLKAGRDRVRILSLPGSLLETDQRAVDTFLVRRVETTLDSTGLPQTRIEFDGGADLLEVLQARLSIAAVLAG